MCLHSDVINHLIFLGGSDPPGSALSLLQVDGDLSGDDRSPTLSLGLPLKQLPYERRAIHSKKGRGGVQLMR